MSIFFYSSVVIPIIQAAREHNFPIKLVKNNGVYLMVKVNNKTIIRYAKNCNPNSDADYFDSSSHYLGDSDFIESFDPHHKIFDWVTNCQLNLEVNVKDEKLILSAVRGD